MRLTRYGTLLLLGFAACDASITDDPMGVADTGAVTLDAGAPTGGEREDPDFDAGSCFDGLDNDRDGQMDCAEDACGVRRECCVASTSVACCGSPSPVARVEIACPDGPASSCAALEGEALFGSPTIEDGALVPQGGPGHGGLVLDGPIDPRAGNLRLEAVVRAPEVACGDCVDFAGIAFVAAPPAPGVRAPIWLGVLGTSGRDEVQVIVADEVVHRFELPFEAIYAISLEGSGAATVSVDGVAVPLDGLTLPPEVHAVVIGRTDNRAAGVEAMRVHRAELQRADCDMPAALARAASPRLPGTASSFRPNDLGRVAAVVDEGALFVVFADDGDLFVAREAMNGGLVPPASRDELAVTPLDGTDDLRDPALHRGPGGVLQLYFAAEASDGRSRIFRAPREGDRFGTPDLALEVDGASVDGPAVWSTADGLLRMVARVSRPGAPSELAIFGASGDAPLERLEGLRQAPVEDLFAFDRDEVAQPAIAQTADGLYRLYYAGRRGTAWSAGLLVSEDGVAWRPLGRVLGPDGDGFDALSVRGPAPVVRSDLGGALHLYYTGSDGAGAAIGLAGPAGTLGE